MKVLIDAYLHKIDFNSGEGECFDNYDCPDFAPYCSRYGYCRETSRYGSGGPYYGKRSASLSGPGALGAK